MTIEQKQAVEEGKQQALSTGKTMREQDKDSVSKGKPIKRAALLLAKLSGMSDSWSDLQHAAG